MLELLRDLRRYLGETRYKKKQIIETRRLVENHGNRLLEKNPKYYLEGYNHNCENHPMAKFIKDFIVIGRHVYFTTDIKDGKTVCDTGRRRSLGDIFLICRSYYPQCTIHGVLEVLVQLLESREIYGCYCNTINKYVFHRDSDVYRRHDKVEYNPNINFKNVIDAYKV